MCARNRNVLECGICGDNHDTDDCDQETTDECYYCGGEHDSEDCDVDECVCAHCGETIDNCDDEHPEGSKHVTPADWKEISRKRAFRTGGIIS